MEGSKNIHQVLKTSGWHRLRLYYEENKTRVAKISSKPVIEIIIIL